MKICFATNNQNKVSEIQDLLGDHFELVTLGDVGCTEELAEDQDTLEGNSLQKAEYVAQNYDADCFADDTGLEISSLNGEPGVYSARYAGAHRSNEDNINLVLEKLASHSDRSAQFRTVITLIIDGVTHQLEGIAKGRIIEQLKGNEGFGYDPIFIPEGETRTFAEMTKQEKNAISHRGKAIRKLVEFLKTHKSS